MHCCSLWIPAAPKGTARPSAAARGPAHVLHVVLLGGSNQRCLLWVLRQWWLLLLLTPLAGRGTAVHTLLVALQMPSQRWALVFTVITQNRKLSVMDFLGRVMKWSHSSCSWGSPSLPPSLFPGCLTALSRAYWRAFLGPAEEIYVGWFPATIFCCFKSLFVQNWGKCLISTCKGRFVSYRGLELRAAHHGLERSSGGPWPSCLLKQSQLWSWTRAPPVEDLWGWRPQSLSRPCILLLSWWLFFLPWGFAVLLSLALPMKSSSLGPARWSSLALWQ